MSTGRNVSSAHEEPLAPLVSPTSAEGMRQRGFVRRIWSSMGAVGHLFLRNSKEDFEKTLKHLSKEEVAVHNRVKTRTQYWRKFARGLILYSVIGEVLILGFALWTTRATKLSWETRAFRVFPVFALPLLSSLLYSTCARFYRMRERKDQEKLERLRMERQAKLDELKEKTNYYLTQQLIQQYDSDPAAKAAAARVLASKLGADAGLKLELQDVGLTEKEDASTPSRGKNNLEPTDSMGLRKRKPHGLPVDGRESSGQSGRSSEKSLSQGAQVPGYSGGRDRGPDDWEQVEHQKRSAGEGGWIARLAAMLVGEDPSQCYALICAKCHMHNGLAKKEDFQYITYYCPHCHALNRSTHLETGEASENSRRDRLTEALDSPATPAGSTTMAEELPLGALLDTYSAASSVFDTSTASKSQLIPPQEVAVQ